MKKNINVCIAQIKLEQFDLQETNKKVMAFAQKAHDEHNADLLLFPELCYPGYIIPRDREFGLKYYKHSKEIPGPTTNGICKAASKYGLYIAIGMGRRHPVIPGVLLNSAVLIGPKGNIIGIQDKIHMPGYEKNYFEEGSQIKSFSTKIGKIGMIICYDNQFPEYARLLSLEGCTIICMMWCMPTYGGHPSSFLEHMTAARAAENRCYTLSSNPVGHVYGSEKDYFTGTSCAADPLGNLLTVASDTKEQMLTVQLDPDVVITERIYQPIFNDRRPELYKPLLSKANINSSVDSKTCN